MTIMVAHRKADTNGLTIDAVETIRAPIAPTDRVVRVKSRDVKKTVAIRHLAHGRSMRAARRRQRKDDSLCLESDPTFLDADKK